MSASWLDEILAEMPECGLEAKPANDGSKALISETEVNTMKKEDYVLVSNMRKLSYTSAELWKQSTAKLSKLLTPTVQEYSEILLQRERRAEFDAAHRGASTIEALQDMTRSSGLTCPAGITRGGLIDRLINYLVDHQLEPAIELDSDQVHIVQNRYNDARLIIYAGPGAGKTTTLCHLAKAIVDHDKQARVLMLAYNRCAEETLIGRLKQLKAKRIAKPQVNNNAAFGVAVLTIDKFGYQVNAAGANTLDEVFGTHTEASIALVDEKQSLNTYRAKLEAAIIRLQNGVDVRWTTVIVDEGQDIQPVHASLIEALIAPRGGAPVPRFVVAGDPRQELYPGAVWFSEIWATALVSEKVVLRYNHRSAPEIVKALNAYSRANFPTLHEDQIASRPAGGNIVLHSVNAERDWTQSSSGQKMSARRLGERVGQCLSAGEPRKCYAIGPISVGTFNLDVTTDAARQIVHENRPGALVVPNDNSISADYCIATSMKVKGTERDHVIVFGVDISYSIKVDLPKLIKTIFVALSRARDILELITRDFPEERVAIIMSPIIGTRPSTTLEPWNKGPKYLPYIQVASTNALASTQGLCTSGVSVTVADKIQSPTHLTLPGNHGDDDFLGIYAEALLAHALGVPLARKVTVLAECDPAKRGFGRSEDGTCTLRVEARSVDKLQMMVDSAVQMGTESYTHAALRYSALAGRVWTVSERIGKSRYNVSELASWLLDLLQLKGQGQPTDATPTVRYCVGGCLDLKFTRLLESNTSSSPGRIVYEIDFIINGVPVEIKYVAELTIEHRRQAAIYAAIIGAPRALLLNMRTGVAEWILAPPMRHLTEVARALLSLREAHSCAIGPLCSRTITPPPELAAAAECVIAIDTECTVMGEIVEISAIAFNIIGCCIHDVFDLRHPSAIETPQPKCTERKQLFDLLEDAGLKVPLNLPKWSGEKQLRLWIANLPFPRRVFVHWAGAERTLLGEEERTLDGLHAIFRPWLELGKVGRRNHTRLIDAVGQMVPSVQTIPHRAFEDAIATMSVVVAATKFTGRV